jgi:hypothetical protein
MDPVPPTRFNNFVVRNQKQTDPKLRVDLIFVCCSEFTEVNRGFCNRATGGAAFLRKQERIHNDLLSTRRWFSACLRPCRLWFTGRPSARLAWRSDRRWDAGPASHELASRTDAAKLFCKSRRHSTCVQWSELPCALLTAFASPPCDPPRKQEVRSE